MDGKGKLGKPESEEKSGLSIEAFVASLTPKVREELYNELSDYSYRDFEDEDQEEPEEAEQ